MIKRPRKQKRTLDETRIQVLKEDGRKATTNSFMWLFRTGEDTLDPIILYHYTQTRARNNAEEFLSGFKGYLETDGYQGYNNLAENSIRLFTVGRHNWLFADTPQGARSSAIAYTMVNMASPQNPLKAVE